MVNDMSIIIPSKNIYNFTKNIIRDNAITGITIPVFSATTIQTKGTEAFNATYLSNCYEKEGEDTEDEEVLKTPAPDYSDYTRFYYAYAYASIIPKYEDLYIYVPKSYRNKTVTSITANKIEDLNITIKGTLEKGTVEKKIDWANKTFGNETNKKVTETLTNQSFSKKNSASETKTEGVYTVTAEASFDDETLLLSSGDTTTEYVVRVKILSGYKIITAIGSEYVSTGGNPSDIATCNYEEFIPTEISISINGDTSEFTINETNIEIGDTKKQYKVSESGLLQVGMSPTPNELFEKTLDAYKNGKETATILASIGEYYDNDGNLAISTKKEINGNAKMVFDIGDEVIPQVYGADGVDRPMSLYPDLTDKVFRVCGTKIFYDGAVWQELTLQEVTKGV